MSAAGACLHERSQIVDSRFHGHHYGTVASRRIFCDNCRIQRWLDVEAALAASQAALGLIPEQAAKEIAAAARLERIDLEELTREIRRTGHSLVAVLAALQAACPPETGELVHYGATTQDIQDTAQALEMADVLTEVDFGLREIVGRLTELAVSHRDTVMIGRTHARPALPITFGLKVAGWVDELLRHADRLEGMRPRVLVAQLFGGAGTMAAFGSRGPELLDAFAARLGLGVTRSSWHVARDGVAEYAATLAMLAGTCGRIAEEVRMLSRPEYGELEERWEYGQIGSSTMPHKRNPESCEQVVVLARLARAEAGVAVEGMIQEHERDGRGLRLEWAAVADVSHHALAALGILGGIVDGLTVHVAHMAEKAREAGDALCSEALMLALGRHVGKQTAHAAVYELSQAAQNHGRPLRDVVGESAWARCFTDGELDDLLDPANHVGSAGEIVDRTVGAAAAWLAGGDRT